MTKLKVMMLLLAAATAAFGATTTVKFGSAMDVEIDGVVHSFASDATFNAPDGPHVYKMRPVLSAGERTFGIQGSEANDAWRYPLYGDGNWVRVALPDDGSVVKLYGRKATGIYYVDAVHGNNDWDGTADYEHRDEAINKGPKLTLQAAHDVAEGSYPIVLAAPGIYDKGVTNTYYSGTSYLCKRRLYITKMIGFIATNGPDSTFIVGAPDPQTHGLGDDAVSGVYVKTANAVFQFLQGFTITGCYSPATQDRVTQYGAAFCTGSGNRVSVLDCVISNNFARFHSATCYGVIHRTRIVDNESRNYVDRYSTFVSCVISGNRLTYGDGTGVAYSLDTDTTYYFCTFDLHNAGNPSGRQRLEADGSNLHGSFAYGLTDKSRTTESSWHDSLASDNPVFADAGSRDYRIGALSPAIDGASYNNLTKEAKRFLVADIDGRAPVVNGGKVRLGAVWNDPAQPVTVISAEGGEISVSGGSAGTNVIASADTITVTATKSATRPFVGFEVNGAMLPYAGTSYSFTPSLAVGSVNAVRAVYDTNWYVDCVHGNDINPGTAGLPKQTIRAATTNAISGDVIHVAPGMYGAIEGTQTVNSTGASRVVVPAGVTVESTGGAENTFIVGEEATDDQIDNTTYGTGTNAVRCVYALGGAKLRGFTLTGGRGVGVQGGTSTGAGIGSGFYSAVDRAATIEDCIVSNNAIYISTIHQAIVRRCRIFDNIAINDDASGAGAYSCELYNSIIDRNRGNGTVTTAFAIESCTIGANNLRLGGRTHPRTVSQGTRDVAIVNSAILDGGLVCNSATRISCTNCLIAVTSDDATRWRDGVTEERLHNTIFTNETGAQVDERYCPKLGSFAGIDRGAVASPGDTDVYGTPRVLNGTIDIGAVEYDWRPAFGNMLGTRFTVESVSPSVTTNATGGLLVSDGEVAGKVISAGPYGISFNVTGGSLAVYVGEALVGESSGTGDQSIRFIVTDAADEIRFVAAGGAVILKQFSGARGFSISFR